MQANLLLNLLEAIWESFLGWLQEIDSLAFAHLNSVSDLN